MKAKLFLTVLMIFSLLDVDAQNPFNIETKLEFVDVKKTLGASKTADIDPLQTLSTSYNNKGFKLINMMPVKISGDEKIILIFEKSSSYREAELYKLITELTTRIDTTSKKHTDSAMLTIQTNVLNYLKSIPNDVITQAYKEELTKMIMLQADTQLRAIVEELKKEIRETAQNK